MGRERDIPLTRTPHLYAALEVVHFGRVFRSPSRRWSDGRGRTQPKWLSTTHTLTRAMEQALDTLLAHRALDMSRGPAISISLSPAGRRLLISWEPQSRPPLRRESRAE